MARHIFDRILSLEEASERYNLSASWLRRLAGDGIINAKKVGKTWIVLEEEMEKITGTRRPRGRPSLKTLTSQVGGAGITATLRSKQKAAKHR